MKQNNNGKYKLTEDQLSKFHMEDLGLNIPKDYFASSKNEILEKTILKEKAILRLFLETNPFLKIAASVVLIFGVFIYIQFNFLRLATKENTVVELDKKSKPIALVSRDSNLTNTVKNVKIFKTNNTIEHKEKKEEDVVQNETDILVKSLFVEESEVDQYIENSILEDI